jgi:membrane peptidoglycan carboxypeptidase
MEAAARGFFGRSAIDLTLAQSAFLASRVGDTRTDPWCEPAVATAMRNRVLDRMRINGAISEIDFETASVAELGLGPPPEGRPPCNK